MLLSEHTDLQKVSYRSTAKLLFAARLLQINLFCITCRMLIKSIFMMKKNKTGIANNLIPVKITAYDFKIRESRRGTSALIGLGFFIVPNI